MQESMFSPLWHRYSQLKPKLKNKVKVQPQQYRNQQWYIITGVSGNQVRINSSGYAIIGRCDGRFTIQQIWQAVLEVNTEDAPTQDEVIQLLNDLDEHDLLVYDVLPDMQNLFKRKKIKQTQHLKAHVNPFTFRIPLWDPSQFLNRFNPILSTLFSSFSIIVWLAFILLGTLLLVTHWVELSAHATLHLATQRYILIAWLAYPVVKAIHELSHALAIKKWGGVVKETGITLLMLTPAPYVDATDVVRFKSKYQRVIVSLVGIMTELFMAVIALIVYLTSQPGLTQDIAFVIAFICGISSLLFNGNPLLRFDAYYAMCDWLALPNLASRSKAYWSNFLSRLFLGGKDNLKPLNLAKGEQKWLFVYAPLSLLYILLVFSTLIIIVGSKSFILGLILTTVFTIGFLFKPLYSLVKRILTLSHQTNRATKTKLLLIGITALFIIGVFIVPMPNTTMAEGIVLLDDNAQLRAESDGVLRRIFVKNNEIVSKGQLIMLLENDDLNQDQNDQQNQLNKLNVDQYNAIFNNPEQAKNIAEQIEKLKLAIERTNEKIENLKVYSNENGRLVMPQQQDLLNAYIKQGTAIGYVLNQENIKLRVALPAGDINQVKNRLVNVNVKLQEQIDQTYDANVDSFAPSATNTLPNKALGDQGGGALSTNPEDKTGLTSTLPIFWVDLSLINGSVPRAGGRAYIRFNQVSEPMAQQFFRHVKQIFLSQFNPTS
jgi:putative peptide zinc metalloprotease protein